MVKVPRKEWARIEEEWETAANMYKWKHSHRSLPSCRYLAFCQICFTWSEYSKVDLEERFVSRGWKIDKEKGLVY